MNKKKVSASLAGTVSLAGEVSVNRLGFGAMRLTGEGIWGPPRDRKKALAVLRRAVELDVNFIDTADSYGPNVSEELIAYRSGFLVYAPGLTRKTFSARFTQHTRQYLTGGYHVLDIAAMQRGIR